MTTDRTILESDTAERDREILAEVYETSYAGGKWQAERLRAGENPSIPTTTILKALSRARAEERESKWQDIATAPRDGSKVLSWNGKHMAVVEWYHDGEDGFWRGDARIGPDPTHWLPLPPPPSSGRDK